MIPQLDTIAERLRWIRVATSGKRGMSAFARLVEVSSSGYLNYERGERSIPSDVLARISKSTNVNVGWLITGQGEIYTTTETDRSSTPKLRERLGATAGAGPPKEQIVVEGAHHTRAFSEYWPTLRTWVERTRLRLWLIGEGSEASLAFQGFDTLVYLDRLSQADRRVIDNLSVETVLFPSAKAATPEVVTEWSSRAEDVFIPLDAVEPMASSQFDPESDVLRAISPYWANAFPFCQNMGCLLERLSGQVREVEIILRSPEFPAPWLGMAPSLDTLLCQSICLVTLVGDISGAEVQNLQTNEDGHGVKAVLGVTTYVDTQATVSLDVAASSSSERRFELQLRGEKADGPTLRLDFHDGWVSLVEAGNSASRLMPLVHNPCEFFLERMLSGDALRNLCTLPISVGMDASRLCAGVREQLGRSRTIASDELGSVLTSATETVPFQAVPKVARSLPLTHSDRQLLNDVIEAQNVYLNHFQSTLHPDIVRDLDYAIRDAQQDGVEGLPRLVKHCLLRSTIGTTTALLISEIMFNLAREHPDKALAYARSIPDRLLSDKLQGAYSVVMGLALHGKIAEPIQIIQNAMKVVHRQDGVLDRLKALFVIASMYASVHEAERTQRVIEQIRELLDPNVVPGDIVVKSHRQFAELEAMLGHLHLAQQLLDHALRFGKRTLTETASLDIHLSRSYVQYVALSNRLQQHGDIAQAHGMMTQAERIIDQITAPWHQVEALTEGVKGYYNHLAGATWAWSQLSQAIEIAQAIPDSRRCSFALSRVVECLVILGDMEQAVELSRSILDPVEAASASMSIALAHIDEGDTVAARPFLNEAIRMSEKAQGNSSGRDILHLLIAKLVKNHEMQAAFKLAHRRAAGDDRVLLLMQLVQAISGDANQGWVQRKINELVERSQTLLSGLGRLLASVRAAIIYRGLGEQEGAELLMAAAERILAELTNPEGKLSALLAIAEYQGLPAMRHRVEAWLDEMGALARNMADPTDVLTSVARGWARIGQPDRAVAIVGSEIPDPAYQSEAIGQLAVVCTECGELEYAASLLPEVKSPYYRAMSLAQQVCQLAQAGNTDAARETLAPAIRAAEHLGLPDNRAQVHALFAHAYAELGDATYTLAALCTSLREAARSTRETVIGVLQELVPAIAYLGGTQLLSEVYVELERADAIFSDEEPALGSS